MVNVAAGHNSNERRRQTGRRADRVGCVGLVTVESDGCQGVSGLRSDGRQGATHAPAEHPDPAGPNFH